MPSTATRTDGSTSVDLYGPRNRMLAVLAAWVLWTITLGPSLGILADVSWYAQVAPGVGLALALGALVYVDFGRLENAGIAWGTGRLVVALASALLPPYAFLYLWKRGRELSH